MRIQLILALLFAIQFSACTKKAPEALAKPTPASSELLLTTGKVLAKSESQDLPFKIYRFLASDQKNICLSPLSLEQAFSMVYLGSNAKTKSQIEQIFGFKSDKVYSLSAEDLGREVDFYWGNSIWSKPGKSLSPSFLEATKKRLNAEHFSTLDLKKINQWVAKSTRDHIQDLIKQLELNTLTVLVNAFYLNAPWETPFEKSKNLFGPFQSNEHMASQVVYLSQVSQYLYFEDSKSIWVELPYRGGSLSMLLALPKNKLDLRSIEDQLDAKYLSSVLQGLKFESVDLKIPKFKMESALSLKRTFMDLGYADLFTQGDFSRMTIQPEVKISEIIQATYLKVDENGTEAAAATAVLLEKGSAPFMGKPKPFYANQPFLYLIRNKKSNKIYFIGRVFDPRP